MRRFWWAVCVVALGAGIAGAAQYAGLLPGLWRTAEVARPASGRTFRSLALNGAASPVAAGFLQAAGGQQRVVSTALASGTATPASLDIDLRQLPIVSWPRRMKKPEPRHRLRPAATDVRAAMRVDPIAQTFHGAPNMPVPVLNYDGMDFNTAGAGWPPDTNGDVGPNHYIETVNTSIQIFNKAGSSLAGPTEFNTFFTGAFSPCDIDNNTDPIVFWDPVADRWVITDMAWSYDAGPFYECMAISKTANPVTGGWWLYTIKAHDTWLNDYPKFGVWRDGWYMSANMFGPGLSGSFQGTRIFAFNRNEMINGLSTTYYFNGDANTILDGGLLPANVRGKMPPDGTPEVFVSVDPYNSPSTSYLNFYYFYMDWVTPANSWLTKTPVQVTTAALTLLANDIPQPGGYTADRLDDRAMMNAQYRRVGNTQSLWLNHTVASSGVGAIRWYEVRDLAGTPSIYQQGTYQPDTNYRWMASVAADRQGNVAVGYSVSSSSVYPSVRYAGRLVNDTAGLLSQGETSLIAGSGSQTTPWRWGDYSAMTVDPVDDCTFWYTQEYYSATGDNWKTRMGNFKYTGCNPSGTAPAFTSWPSSGFRIGVSNAFTVMATGNATPSLSKTGSLPSGVTFVDNFNGTATVSGTPGAGTAGTYSLTFTATNGSGSATQTFLLVVTTNAMPAFSDEPLTSRSTLVKAVHVLELRARVASLRTTWSLGAYLWTDSTLTARSTNIKGAHIADLRTALNQVYTAAGKTLPTYTDPTITTTSTQVKAVHIAELRAAVEAIW